jgi:RNA polymerase sigma factor (sigma-70 family)
VTRDGEVSCRAVSVDDLALLDAWRDGDVEAGDALFGRHFGGIRRFFRNKLPPSDVEDAVQRTFLACLESRDQFRGDSSFRTYLYVLARHQLHRILRRRRGDAVAAGVDFGVTSLLDLGVSPSTAFAKDEEQQLVLEGLRRLAVDQQILLELYYWQDLKGPELAKILEVAEPTVRTRLFRARQRLREIIAEIHSGKLARDIEDTARAIEP